MSLTELRKFRLKRNAGCGAHISSMQDRQHLRAVDFTVVGLLGICFWREAPETAVGPDRRAGNRGLPEPALFLRLRRFIQANPFRRSLRLHRVPLAAALPPLSFLAPSLRLGPKRSRALANASFTNSLLPITAPSVK